MTKYDHIVVGSGASGLTSTLLLALNGRKVLLLEKAPRIGGSLARFSRQGVPFDTGFHFTGGLTQGGLLHRILSTLNLADAVEPVFMSADRAHRFVIESENRIVDLPSGIPALRRKLKDEFPAEQAAVDGYMDRVIRVCSQTAGMDLRQIGEPSFRLEEELISLKSVMDGLTDNAVLKSVVYGLGMCYGVKPSEVSFASHARVCFDLYESTARLKAGGESLIHAFEQAFRKLDVEVRCNSWIAECGRVTDRRVESFILNDGQEVSADATVLTIHPHHILKLLPGGHLSKAFVDRVESFEPSAGFFTVYGVLETETDRAFGSTIVSLFPSSDFEALLDPGYRGDPALVICGSLETVRGVSRQVVTTFEPSFPEHVAAWKESRTGHRPTAYEDYKAGRIEAIRQHLSRYDPFYASHFRVLDAASLLTFRDYLHSPDGSAYGIKQKVGQYNLIGRLPIRNLFAAGQSALLPGLAGAMMSSFFVIRSVLGKETFNRFIQRRTPNSQRPTANVQEEQGNKQGPIEPAQQGGKSHGTGV
jgi:phytoene dehydrogenase-like protein